MLVGERPSPGPDVALVIEDDAAFLFGVKLLAMVRKAGHSAEMLASGSPRKRFDKAVKLNPGTIVAVALHNGVPVPSFRKLADAPLEFEIRTMLETVVP